MYNSHIIHSSHLRHNLPFSKFNRSINLHSRGCLLTNIILIPCRHIRRMFICFHVSVPLTEARRQRLALEDAETRRTSSRGLIPRAKVKTIKMTFVIIFGEWTTTCCLFNAKNPSNPESCHLRTCFEFFLFQFLFFVGPHTSCSIFSRWD